MCFRDEHGATPLHIAAANGYQSVLEFLLDHHCSTEVVDHDLWQPLHAAACWGHLEAVEILAQNGADISALTRAGETPFDITEDPDIKERLVELAEQRLRQAEPRLRKGRSSSTRTHSIRRTSLRDKMKTTKKDVTEEGLIYMKTVQSSTQSNASPEDGGQDDYQPSQDIVDVGDVKLTLNGGGNSPSGVSLQSSPVAAQNSQQMSRQQQPLPVNSNSGSGHSSKPMAVAKPVQMVTPFNKSQDPSMPPLPPSRSSRASADRKLVSSQSGDDMTGSPPRSNWSSTGSGNEPINIHVSVTINPGPGIGPVGGVPNPQHPSGGQNHDLGGHHNNLQHQVQGPGMQHQQYVHPGSYVTNTGTLADLKRSRSQSRVSGGSNSSSTTSLAATAAVDPVSMKPRPDYRTMQPTGNNNHPGVGNPNHHQRQEGSSSSTSPSSNRKKFAASSIEVVGPPGKSGCCLIL